MRRSDRARSGGGFGDETDRLNELLTIRGTVGWLAGMEDPGPIGAAPVLHSPPQHDTSASQPSAVHGTPA